MDYSEANYKWYRCYCCGNNHVPENCPFLLWQQTYVDNLSRRSWNFEQDECWNPHLDPYSHAIDSPFISYSHVQGNSFEDGEISRREERLDRLERLANNYFKMQEDYITKFESSVQNIVVQVSQMRKDLEEVKQKYSFNHISPLLSNEIEYEEVGDMDDHEVKEDLEVVLEPKTALGETDG